MGDEKLDWRGIQVTRRRYKKGARLFGQGEACRSVLYLDDGAVRLSVLSHTGKEAVIALIGPGHFFGEGCLAGQPLRMSSADAVAATTVVDIDKDELAREMALRPDLAKTFLRHMLTRNIRIEADLIDQLFNDVEKRLARTLLLMARFGKDDPPHRRLPQVSQTILAGMVGTTRSRVNAFMNKFRKLGFIQYNGDLKVNHSLLTVLLKDGAPTSSGATAAPSTRPRRPRAQEPRVGRALVT
jgi:CRP/FNR family transcriptional regulator, cyclic AMP receptor protein